MLFRTVKVTNGRRAGRIAPPVEDFLNTTDSDETWEKPQACTGVAMIETLSPADIASDLRYALDVLDDYEHLGLDAEYATKLRRILIRRIEETGGIESCCPAQPVRFPVSAESSS